MLEKKILVAATVFALALFGVIVLSVRLFGIDLPTCLTDVRPFKDAKVIEQGPKRYEIHYVARMWKFEPPDVTIPPGSTADVYVASADVTHGLQIIGTNVNLEVVPGAVNFARVKFDKAGDYLVVCNEYCGMQHHNMAARIHVAENRVAPAILPADSPASASATSGSDLVAKYACTACHSLDGSPMTGPPFKGLYGSKRFLADGKTVTADDAYLTESIDNPNAKVVKAFDPVMPQMPIPPNDVRQIVEYLETLK
jgi:cytochrome c oxidase subunit 2